MEFQNMNSFFFFSFKYSKLSAREVRPAGVMMLAFLSNVGRLLIVHIQKNKYGCVEQ